MRVRVRVRAKKKKEQLQAHKIMSKINIQEKMALIHEQWTPKVIGNVNSQQIRLAKIQGNDFALHCHEEGDELFYVLNGSITLEFEDKKIDLNQGEFYVVPKGVYHRPVCEKEAEIMLIVQAEALNTGNVQNEYTINKLDEI